MPLSQWSTSVEIRLKRIPVVILASSKLLLGGESLVGLEKEYIVQLPKKSKYGEIKKRLADCINAARATFLGTESDGSAPITDADIRMWKFSDQ